MTDRIPDGFVLARTTAVFNNHTVPASLLKAHRVADSVIAGWTGDASPPVSAPGSSP